MALENLSCQQNNQLYFSVRDLDKPNNTLTKNKIQIFPLILTTALVRNANKLELPKCRTTVIQFLFATFISIVILIFRL